MNVIISNKNHEMLQSLNIDVIKSMNGEFSVDEIIDTFKNFFFQRMILDITAIKGYKDISNLQKLSISLDMDKVILVLDGDESSVSPVYLSQLISLSIYNFTRNVEGIMYLYNNPNSYRDVAQFHQLNISTDNKSNLGINVFNNNSFTPATNQQQQIIQSVGSTNAVSNQYKTQKLIGVKNVTKQSGATTLVYLMKKALEKKYDVVAMEINKRDFMFFPDKTLISSDKDSVSSYLESNKDRDIILIDLNDDAYTEQKCDEVIYLIEPSIIKLNTLMMINPNLLKSLANKKVVLNQSVLSNKDVLDFEYESKLKVYYNMPELNDRDIDNPALNAFLNKLGFNISSSNADDSRKKILGIF